MGVSVSVAVASAGFACAEKGALAGSEVQALVMNIVETITQANPG
jgi:hypothetical protein